MNIITLGTFDLPHWGHFNLLNKCRNIVGTGGLVVGLNTDEFILKYKGRNPVMTYSERERSLMSLNLVDLILSNSQDDGSAKTTILDSKADFIVIGSDWARKDYVAQLGLNWDWLDENSIGVIYTNYTKGISTTEIKRRLCKSA